MKIRHTLTLPLAGILLALSGAALADAAGTVSIESPYARAVPPGTPNSAVFMGVSNTDSVDHALVSAASPASEVVELHTHIMEDGLAKMREVPKIDVPAGGQTMLKPGGLHVMLIGLKQDLEIGQQVEVTLTFEDGSKKHFSAPVKPVKRMMHHGGMKH
ncbi:MAG: copper chaperone PCu(A)C [Gammaproteobacteria bacterium]